MLCFGEAAEDALLAPFREVMAVNVDHGVVFDLNGLKIKAIPEVMVYGGSRLHTTTVLAGARIPITVDIGFGDAIEPGAKDIVLSVLLDMPSPHLRAYPPKSVMAEKFHAMVALGRANSRMKDYYEVWMLAHAVDFELLRLKLAISATFLRRNTAIPTQVPDGLSDAFAGDPAKQRQWAAFTRELSGPIEELGSVVAISDALEVHLETNRKRDDVKFTTYARRAFASLVAVTGDKEIKTFTRADARKFIAKGLEDSLKTGTIRAASTRIVLSGVPISASTTPSYPTLSRV